MAGNDEAHVGRRIAGRLTLTSRNEYVEFDLTTFGAPCFSIATARSIATRASCTASRICSCWRRRARTAAHGGARISAGDHHQSVGHRPRLFQRSRHARFQPGACASGCRPKESRSPASTTARSIPTEGIGPYRCDSPLRKPQAGHDAAGGRTSTTSICAASFAIGDKKSDVLAGQAAGCRTVLLATGAGGRGENELAARADYRRGEPARGGRMDRYVTCAGDQSAADGTHWNVPVTGATP